MARFSSSGFVLPDPLLRRDRLTMTSNRAADQEVLNQYGPFPWNDEIMPSVIPKTVGESLYWSYANLAMASARHGEPSYQQIDYIVRSKNYYGLLRGKLQLGSLLKDEKEKIAASDACCYCGSKVDLTLDHLVPQFKGGEHSADNTVVACRSCNSCKNALDFLEWMAKRGEFPPLVLLRRYLKLAIRDCVENGLMDISLASAAAAGSSWPFAIALIPHTFPNLVDLVARVPAADDCQR